MLMINLEYYYKNYKKIVEKSLDISMPLPYSLAIIPVPQEYDFTLEEKQHSSLPTDELMTEYARKRQEEIQLFKEDKDTEQYHKKELEDWIKKNKEFQDITNLN